MAEILKVDLHSPEPECIARAAISIRAGNVVAIPTDTVYGLAADPFQPVAVERIFTAKGRPPDAPVLLLVDSIEMAASVAKDLPQIFQTLAKKYWPGPLTLVVEASDEIPSMITGNTGRVGIRFPAATIAQVLMRAVGGPITGTSANRSGQPESRTAGEVNLILGKFLPLILDGGPSTVSVPSTVVGLREDSWELIREGVIQRAELELFFRGVNIPLRKPESQSETGD